jgi:hypothetical protein
MEAMNNLYGFLVADLEGNRAFGRSRRRCKDNAKRIKKWDVKQ